MAEHTESDIAIRFVDENDYTVIPARIVLAIGKSKKNRPSWLVFKDCYDVDSSEVESSSEDDDSSSDETKSRKSAGKSKPGSSSSIVTKSRKMAPKKSNKRTKSLSEDEMEDLCGQLEEKRQDLDVKIREKMASSVNLEFYPSRVALRKELLADKSVLSELTSEFIDKLIELIRRIFLTNMTPRNKKAALTHEWSKKLKSFRDSVILRKLCREFPKTQVQEISRVDEIAILSCIHEGIYDFIHSLSHDNVHQGRTPAPVFSVMIKLFCIVLAGPLCVQ